MKAHLIISAGLLLPVCAFAQTRQKSVVVQTEHQHKGASHQSTRTNPGVERTSTASWHYHSGPKRTQVKIETSPERAEDRKPDAGQKTDSTGK